VDQFIDFQSMIMRLQNYWAEEGCLIWQPYYTQVGAGTYNPATFLRVLGPEPWNVAYVEPSVRPDDGRYGENPYRFQQHYQFQVILKPDPGNPQELYLKSLQALGIDPLQHDIRFVEDNWESPALGAWGLGWEVWLDGQEITQFTYFQQAGGFELNPVSVEITYGLERLAMPLQNHYHFRDLKWNSYFTYSDLNYQGEKEHSQYYFEDADIERLRVMFELFEKEAKLALDKGLVLPAHDYILKCSHTFNVLDTRGAVGVTDRQAMFSRMRDLAHRSAQAYINQRQAMGFPWLEKKSTISGKIVSKPDAISHPKKYSVSKIDLPFLMEIGTEELPAGDLISAIAQLTVTAPKMLDDLHLKHGEVKIFGTPRRLVVYVEKLALKQSDSTQIIKGPPVNRGFDKNGQPSQAAIGFAANKGIQVKDLKTKTFDNGDYLVAEIDLKGQSIFDALPDELPKLIVGLHFDKAMRWNASNVSFSRPIRWLMALYGNQPINFEYAGITSNQATRGLRFHTPETILIKDSQDYFTFLAGQGIQIDPEKRKQIIEEQVKELIKIESGEPKIDADLLSEVNNLVEAPTALTGSFDQAHLSLPKQVLISVMKKHQRYFPIVNTNDDLLPRFITVRNGDQQFIETVAYGNEQVIQARFADANFFINEDLKHKLEDFLPRLKNLIFHIKLGSMLDKSRRIRLIVEKLSKILGFNTHEIQISQRAAELCKADLVTNMVIEMTALQGIMGHYYALKSGESSDVAQAIEEHYYPRFSGDESPSSKAGFVIGLADRLDSLAGLFAVGMAPSGTKDPFALRRAAIGLVHNLIKRDADFDLNVGLDLAGEALQSIAPLSPEVQKQCLTFIVGRLENYLLDQEYRYDVVAAVLAEQGNNPSKAFIAINQLSAWVKRKDWTSILPAYARCVRITRDVKMAFPVNSKYTIEASEKELAAALKTVQSAKRTHGSIDDLFNAFLPIIPVINQFFDSVMVMVEDQQLRQNRLGLLQQISSLTRGIADFSKLEGF
jgi:glycyl-tRNA synthetase